MHSLHNLVHWSWDFHSHCEFFQETVCLGLQGSLSKPNHAKSLMVRCSGLPTLLYGSLADYKVRAYLSCVSIPFQFLLPS